MNVYDIAVKAQQIDTVLGDGYAAAHPEILAASIVAEAIDGLRDAVDSIDLSIANLTNREAV